MAEPRTGPSGLTVSFKGMDRSDAVQDRIEKRFQKLRRNYDRITECRVTVESPHRQHHKGKLFAIRIHALLPTGDLVVNRDAHDKHAHEDIYVALRDAFDALDRRLEDHVRKMRGRERTSQPREPGTTE